MSNARKRPTPAPTPKPILLDDVNARLNTLSAEQAANDAARKTQHDRLTLTILGIGNTIFKVTPVGGLICPGGFSYTPEQCQQIRTFLNSVFSPIA